MALNRTKVLEAAQKFLQKGQHDKAIAEYQKLVKEDPRDVRTLLKIGDLHTRRGNNTDAIETYGQVAEQYAKQGFFLKAVAVYKQILKLDPEQLAVSERLAGMYEELALISDALTTYEAVADGYARAGNTERALETMQRMVDLDPDNIAVRIKHAEALSRAEQTEEAAAAFAAGAALLKDQGRIDDYIRVAERQLYHQPQNIQLAKELSNLYLERKDAKRALAKLQLCFKDNPRDIQTLEMLAEAFRQLGQGSKTISVLREIARIHAELGAEEPRRRALSRILDLDPDDQEARQALGAMSRDRQSKFGATMIDGRSPEERAEDAARRADGVDEEPLEEPLSDEPVEDLDSADVQSVEVEAADDDDDLLLADDDGEEILIVDDEADEVLGSEPPPPSRREREPETRDERAARLMAEADVKAAAGLWLEVEGLLEEVLELTPDEVPARERLKDLYLELERHDEAVQQLLLLADAWVEHDIQRAIGYTQHAAHLAPDDPRPKLRLEALSSETQASAAVDPLDQPIAPDDFDAEPVRRTSAPPRGLQDQDVDALLDAPIEDDFDAPVPAAAPADLPDTVQPGDDVPDTAQQRRGRSNTLADALPRPSDVDGLLDGTLTDEQVPQAAAVPEYGALLDAPIEDDFGAPPPRREPPETAAVDSLLDAPIDDDFGPPPAARSSASQPPLDLLDAPIEDDFGAPPPAVSAQELDDVDALLDAPIEDDFAAPAKAPADDFGLTDERFEQSDLLEVELEAQHAGKQAQPAAELATIDTGEVELVDDELDEWAEDRGDVTAQGEVPRELLNMQIGTEPPPAPADPDTVEAELPDEALQLSKAGLELPESDLELSIEEPAPREQAEEGAPWTEHAEETAGSESQAAPSTAPPAAAASARATAAETEAHAKETTPPPAEAASEPMEPEVEETIDEAEFFFAQGMYDDAIETVQEALLIYTGNAALKAKLAQYEAAAEQASEEQPAAEAAAEEPDESFRLAEQLAEELGEMPGEPSEAVDVEQVFEQFKKGVAEQVSVDDSATHFDLGIAYKEMGLVDDAMNEFRIASNDPARACLSLTMIGLCLLEQGQAQQAVDEFERALATEQKDARAELGLHFELGSAFEMMSNLEKALTEFELVARQDPSFRDVGQRLERIRSQMPSDNSLDDDSADLDRAFDDLMGDVD